LTHLYKDYQEIVSTTAFDEFCLDIFTANKAIKITRLIFGHTHRQAVRYLSDDLLWLNPGSVSYRRPDDPDQSAHYATINDGVLSLKRASFDLRPLRRYVNGISLKESERDVAEWFFGYR